jgi:chemotaxis protein CheD
VSTIEPIDRVKEINRDGSLFVPIGHYALSNSKNILLNQSPSISIYGLGSCIALVLFDEMNKVSAMSHILLPKAAPNKEINFPHKYANFSVKLLMEEILSHGAMRENIRAIVVGGSKIFDFNNNIMGIDNISSVKEELDSLKIQIIKEDTGGSKGRNVIFDTKDFSLYVKTTGETDFKKIY